MKTIALVAGVAGFIWWGTLLAIMWAVHLRRPRTTPHPRAYSRGLEIWLLISAALILYGLPTI